MTRLAKLLEGSGTGGVYADGDDFTLDGGFKPLKDMTELTALGCWARNVFAGGGQIDLDASATGTFDVPGWIPIEVDNRNNQLTGFTNTNGAVLVVQFRFLVQVSNAAINVTPKVYDITAAALATTSGAAACAATATDYSGTDQQQTLALTLPNAKHSFRPKFTIAGTPAAGYTARLTALFDLYIAA